MQIHGKYFFKEIRDKYNIHNLIAPDGYSYCKIKKVMYGLKQAARLANDKLRDHLASFGYFPDSLSPDVWNHTTRATVFLCVDNFGFTFVNQNDVSHLTNALRTKYKVYIDYEGTNYRALKLN